MKVTLVRTEKENYDVTTFWFKPPHKVSYTAGQFIELTLPHNNPDERGIKHWFTLSSSPSEKLISITTKYFGDKSSTFKQTLFGLRPGVEVHMSDPMGDFVLPKDINIPLVFVAGGIGITPFRSIVKWLLDTGEKRQLQVLLAAHAKNDLVFVDLFEGYGVKPVIVLEEPPAHWNGPVGRLSAELILKIMGEVGNKLIYISGPEPMVEALNEDLEKHQVPKEQLVGDFFPGYTGI